MIVVHDIRAVGTHDGITDFDVDIEWPGERALYRFVDDHRDEIGVLYSPSHQGGLPLAFHREHGWANTEICKVVAAHIRGETLTFPVSLEDVRDRRGPTAKGTR